jgi:YgiT-type zinc finger domain-containing protein
MNCLLCRQSETVDGLTTVDFKRGEMKLTVNNVPARVCPGCGEAYVEEDVAVRLLTDAEEKYQAGTFDLLLDFSSIRPSE